MTVLLKEDKYSEGFLKLCMVSGDQWKGKDFSSPFYVPDASHRLFHFIVTNSPKRENLLPPFYK